MKMQTLFNKRGKTLLQMILSLVLVITAMHSGNAQTEKSFTSADKNIAVAYTTLPAGQTGIISFKITNKGAALVSGQYFNITLPVQAGLDYDMSDIQRRNGMPPSSIGFRMRFDKDFSKDSSLYITCNMLKSNDPQSWTLTFIKK